MKNIVFLSLLSVFVLSSCKNEPKKPEQKENATVEQKVIVKKVKSPTELKAEEKEVVKDLLAFGVEVPENMQYKESLINNIGYKKSVFERKDIGEADKNALDQWYQNQVNQLKKNAWDAEIIQKDENISGSIFNMTQFKKAQGGKSTLSDVIQISTAYLPKQKTYLITFKPYEIE